MIVILHLAFGLIVMKIRLHVVPWFSVGAEYILIAHMAINTF